MQGCLLSWFFNDEKNLMLSDLDRTLALESDKVGPCLPLCLHLSLFIYKMGTVPPMV